MAKGYKNYFRHSINAFDDEKIQNAISKLGFEGYAYYFIIIELLCKICDGEPTKIIKVHPQTLRTILRKQSKSLHKVLTKLQQSGLFVVTFTESFIEFEVPNLSKYIGKYSKPESTVTPNKEKKRKEKKSKENNDFSYSLDDLIALWNNTMVPDFPNSPLSFGSATIKEFIETRNAVKTLDDWNMIFDKCRNIKTYNGDNKINFKAKLQWLLNYDNYTKVFSTESTVKKISQDELDAIELSNKMLKEIEEKYGNGK